MIDIRYAQIFDKSVIHSLLEFILIHVDFVAQIVLMNTDPTSSIASPEVILSNAATLRSCL